MICNTFQSKDSYLTIAIYTNVREKRVRDYQEDQSNANYMIQEWNSKK